jgi:hypothetical protein
MSYCVNGQISSVNELIAALIDYRQCDEVGFYKPDGDWEPESDHSSPVTAADRVAWLNGSPMATPDRESVSEETDNG